MLKKAKLLLAAASVVFAVGVTFAVAGCGEDKHTHTFAEGWTQTATEHWHAATCGHTSEKSAYGTHADTDGDNKCDLCGYDMTPAACTHPYDAEQWLYDSDTHWNLPTCEHTDLRPNEAPHIDADSNGECDVCKCSMAVHQHVWGNWQSDSEQHWRQCTGCEEKTSVGPHIDADGNEVCDTCQAYVQHKHTFGSEYDYDENVHWNVATCKHPEAKGNETEHDFTNGDCVCGAKENYVNVFTAMKEHGLLAANKQYKAWLAELESAAVTNVRVTTAGDIIYEYSESVEYKYMDERTVVIRAVTTDGDPLQDVWFKLSVKTGTGSGAQYVLFADGRTDALTLAHSDESGYAELKFKPLTEYGYSSSDVTYEVRLAEAKDMAVSLRNEEEDNRPIPHRYVVYGYASSYVAPITESDDGNITAGGGEYKFKFSQAWADSDKTMLPYVRYYTMPTTAIGLVEDGETYSFTSSGNGLYDYFYFFPGQNPPGEYSDPAKEEAAQSNARKAASGYYTISFEVSGAAEGARLYYWDDDLDLSVYKNADGSPKDIYAGSISGDIYDGFNEAYGKVFTHSNTIKITVTTALAFSQFQIGFISDKPCGVTLTVSHDADYDEEALIPVIGLGESDNISLSGDGIANPINFGADITAGAYMLEVTANGSQTPQSSLITARIDSGKKILLWSENTYKCLVEIPSGAKRLYLMYNLPGGASVKVKLTKYEETPTVKVNAEGQTSVWVPVVCGKSSSFKVNLDTSAVDSSKTAYVIEFTPTARSYRTGSSMTAPTAVKTTMTYGGGKTMDFQYFDSTLLADNIIGDITALNGELTFFCDNPDYGLIMAEMVMTPIPYVQLNNLYEVKNGDCRVRIKCNIGSGNTGNTIQLVAFTATEAGTYSVTYKNASSGNAVINANDPTNASPIISQEPYSTEYVHHDKSGAFELQAGATILLGICMNSDSKAIIITRQS